MHELDLIPASYKDRLRIKRWCQLFAYVFAGVLVVIISLKFALASKTKSFNSKIAVLQKDKQFNSEQQQKYNTLVAEGIKLEKDLEILNGLRGGPTVKQILLAIDRIMQHEVWFSKLSYHRAGEITQIQTTVASPGYFIIIPKETGSSSYQQAWKLNTHMEINGQALDHSSLSTFIRNLINLPEIDDVKVVNTSMRNYTNSQVVEFNLVVIINNQFKDGHV